MKERIKYRARAGVQLIIVFLKWENIRDTDQINDARYVKRKGDTSIYNVVSFVKRRRKSVKCFPRADREDGGNGAEHNRG